MPSADLAQTTASPRSVSVRIDAETRAKLAELQTRLLGQSSRGSDVEVRRSGIPLGAVVEKALRALERELGEGPSGLFSPSTRAIDPNADAPERTAQQNDELGAMQPVSNSPAVIRCWDPRDTARLDP